VVDKLLPDLYKDYGEYSNYRNFPLDIDGLKPVERRVLLSAYKIARSNFVKSRQVDSYTTGHFHPHGEVYGSIVQLVRQGFLDGQGNFGSNVGVEPVGAAAPRYTECKLSSQTIDLAFKYINYISMVDTELGDIEPIYLPTMFPICLVGREYTQGIGFGYKTFIPCYEMKDLYQRLLWLLKIRKRKPTIMPLTDCNITSEPKILEKLLKTGQAKIEVEGVLDINPRNSTVTLKSWPPGKRFESLLNKFSRELNENMIGFTDLSSAETQIVFQVLRERNRVKIFEDFVDKLKKSVQGVISFETVLVNSQSKVIIKSIDDMLLDTFDMFCHVNTTMIKEEIKKVRTIIAEYKVLERIRDPLVKCISGGTGINSTVNKIQKEVGVQKKISAMLIEKYKIQKLLTLNTDTSELQNKDEQLSSYLKDVNKFVLEQYDARCK
jgi:DNA gyrase/topoisomerase IV subunit A